jgi:hypothetical protein
MSVPRITKTEHAFDKYSFSNNIVLDQYMQYIVFAK